jgi:hypothetical protein
MKLFGVKVVHVATAAVNTGMSSARLEIAEGMDYSLSSTNAYVTDSLQIRIINISKQPLTRVGRS